jgi:hypothetical protein
VIDRVVAHHLEILGLVRREGVGVLGIEGVKRRGQVPGQAQGAAKFPDKLKLKEFPDKLKESGASVDRYRARNAAAAVRAAGRRRPIRE